jgi:hypothetical protein
MTINQLGLEKRAHELAKSGQFEFVYQIERQLIADGYPRVTVTLSKSPELRQALRDDIQAKFAKKLCVQTIRRKW